MTLLKTILPIAIKGKPFKSVLISALLAFQALGCASTPREPASLLIDSPEHWSQSNLHEPVSDDWLTTFQDPLLDALVAEALTANIELAGQFASLVEARSNVIVAGADRWPSLNANLSSTLAQSPGEESSSFGLNADWELDIWGRLSATQKQAVHSLEARKAEYEEARRQLAADVASQWYQLINDQELYELIRLRVTALEADLDIIMSRYRQGIADALDVYLAQTSLLQEQASAETQRQDLIETSTRLQRLLGRYPSGDFVAEAKLPEIHTTIPAGLPSDLVLRRPDLQESWQTLLAADARLAVAHKNRFPRLSLTGRISDNANDIGNIFDTKEVIRSLVANLAIPIFQGGRLSAAENVAEAQRTQAEQSYLSQVQNAFAEVETTVSQQAQLAKRLNAISGAQKNAQAGYELSFEQYQRGLVDYTTVLQAQLRAFNTETALLNLKNLLLQNRIALHQALGGGFSATDTSVTSNP